MVWLFQSDCSPAVSCYLCIIPNLQEMIIKHKLQPFMKERIVVFQWGFISCHFIACLVYLWLFDNILNIRNPLKKTSLLSAAHLLVFVEEEQGLRRNKPFDAQQSPNCISAAIAFGKWHLRWFFKSKIVCGFSACWGNKLQGDDILGTGRKIRGLEFVIPLAHWQFCH